MDPEFWFDQTCQLKPSAVPCVLAVCDVPPVVGKVPAVQAPLEDEEVLPVDDEELLVEDEPLPLDELVPLEDEPLPLDELVPLEDEPLLEVDVMTPEELVVDVV
jgi:hypothetical protein